MQRGVCSNRLYMFDPGRINFKGSSHGYDPFWTNLVGVTGSPPNPRDAHAAAVLENSMFVFGGFEGVVSYFSFPIAVHRLYGM